MKETDESTATQPASGATDGSAWLELLPCPFCGAVFDPEADIPTVVFNFSPHHVTCMNCISDDYGVRVETWNRRAADMLHALEEIELYLQEERDRWVFTDSKHDERNAVVLNNILRPLLKRLRT